MVFEPMYFTSRCTSLTDLGSATRLGLMEMLSIAKGCDMCSEELTINELTRHLTAANAQVRS